MVSPLAVARYFIFRAYEDGRESLMTNMKVQKLLYYTQSLHLALFDEPLFDDEIQAWRYGPVCPPVYYSYREYESRQLPKTTRNELIHFPEETQDLLEEILSFFGEHHAYYLSEMTHLEFPWQKARDGLQADEISKKPILHSDMKMLGQEKLDEMERSHPVYQKVVPLLLKDAFLENTPKSYIKQGEVHDWLNALLA
ncbi:MAG: hypothetical protein DCF20_14925 [Pseudanabaena sp.]|nr:MAG: hypothetical protein DCF20_14925 [Pseudanabaena sp.]